MAEELSYVLVTPYSIRKSRSGGIISRLVSRSGLDLVRAQMFAPSRDFVGKFADTIVTHSGNPVRQKIQELLRDYVLRELTPDAHRNPRFMLLVFKGEDAVAKLRDVVGSITHQLSAGETIRDTYGDYITDAGGNVIHFEPAAIAPQDTATAEANLQLFAAYSDSDGGVVDKAVRFPEGVDVQKTLVLIKPDNFRYPNSRPGGVMDLFSRTGLNIIGMKVHHMSVAQACEFYGPVLDVLKGLHREHTGGRAVELIERELGLTLDAQAREAIGDLLGPIGGQQHWETLVEFMAGSRPSKIPAEEKNSPGRQKCIALVYQGVDAVGKIRAVLGPTDPSKAPAGTIRKEFGQTIMVNAAHASDSVENAEREMGIIRIEENNLKPFVESFYGSL